jgi:outer membrane protein TolC
VLGFNQPLFRFNETAFTLKTARLNQLIGSKIFIKQQEQLALEVSNQYHALLQTQQQLVLLQANKTNTDSLLQTAIRKLKLGKIGEDEYLQIQLEQLTITTQLQQVKVNYELLQLKFCNLLAIQPTELVLRESNPPKNALNQLDKNSITQLLAAYKSNNPEFEQQRLTQLQLEATLKRAKLSRLPNLNLIAGYGSNQSAPVLNNAYQNVLTQQNATIGIAVPLFSSGANTASLKIANYQLQNQQLQLQQIEQRITNDIMSQVQAYNIAIQQISNAQFADSIAQRRYEISYNKYQAGKITYTDLLNAQSQQLQAKQGYLNAITAYWQAYYQLRVTTLFDIEKNNN